MGGIHGFRDHNVSMVSAVTLYRILCVRSVLVFGGAGPRAGLRSVKPHIVEIGRSSLFGSIHITKLYIIITAICSTGAPCISVHTVLIFITVLTAAI